jgi:23S rRNA (uracil1939-C5)-methyltransferase
MACKAKEVVGIEINESAAENAVFNSKLNGVDNARFLKGDATLLSTLNLESQPVIITDPARKGCEPAVLAAIAECQPNRVVMVSCDPATAARDCARLGEFGYKTLKVAGADLFPRTRHVECVALLQKISVSNVGRDAPGAP